MLTKSKFSIGAILCCVALTATFKPTLFVQSYAVGDLHRRDFAGVWKLTGKCSFLPRLPADEALEPQKLKFPMKEFTVYPKKKQTTISPELSPKNIEEEILLMLKEDGQFVQYGSVTEDELHPDEDEDEDDNIPVINDSMQDDLYSLRDNDEQIASTKSLINLGIMKGTWDIIDGKLILAADRPLDSDARKVHDTILVGKVVATEGESLRDNPVLQDKKNDNPSNSTKMVTDYGTAEDNSPKKAINDSQSSSSLSSSTDVHLSVPKGKVKIGKFMYPKKHPSFFELPLFNPTLMGSFSLQQILGTMNTKVEEDIPVERFHKEDLMNKRYFLTSYPIPSKRKKRQRWSIKYNKFVDDKPITKEEKLREEREKNAPVNIRTFEVELLANNTFCTKAGLGNTILRGKWWIIGNEKDQLWMQVWRFGFGRSVSGSTYSEGSDLSQKDEVVYWGKIYELDGSSVEDNIDDDPINWRGKKIEINGSVMDGWGLEPCSVARFTMVEVTEDSHDDDDDDDDNDDDDDDDDGNYFTIENEGTFQ